jgi:hypothetical protein
MARETGGTEQFSGSAPNRFIDIRDRDALQDAVHPRVRGAASEHFGQRARGGDDVVVPPVGRLHQCTDGWVASREFSEALRIENQRAVC